MIVTGFSFNKSNISLERVLTFSIVKFEETQIVTQILNELEDQNKDTDDMSSFQLDKTNGKIVKLINTDKVPHAIGIIL